ncbi:unnamed protein product [Larinioides sclopetarius]|uniref:Uncharacterized protein n=1 Tax=Larinioides sclopetarius TaxID=280406 RepID=A0AAV2A7B7_9ARAC
MVRKRDISKFPCHQNSCIRLTSSRIVNIVIKENPAQQAGTSKIVILPRKGSPANFNGGKGDPRNRDMTKCQGHRRKVANEDEIDNCETIYVANTGCLQGSPLSGTESTNQSSDPFCPETFLRSSIRGRCGQRASLFRPHPQRTWEERGEATSGPAPKARAVKSPARTPSPTPASTLPGNYPPRSKGMEDQSAVER